MADISVIRPKGDFFVMWHIFKKDNGQGLMDKFLGKSSSIVVPIIQRYQTEEMAKKTFNLVSEKGAYRPFLFKLIREG